MLRCALFALAVGLVPVAVSGQTVYGGGVVAADAGTRGFDLGTFPAAGGFVGLRFHDAFSIELHVDRAFAESAEREERIDIFEHSIARDRAGAGRAVLFVWKLRRQQRIGAALTLGMSARTFSTHRQSPGRPAVVLEDGGVGLTAGGMVPIAVSGRWSLAPEVRMTGGVTGEHGTFTQIYSGVRVMWGF
jgi:hypothetical protein